MVIRKGQHRVETRNHARGGDGFVTLHHLAESEQTFNHCRMIVRTVIEPGSSMGYHAHENEMEFFYVLSGELEVNDNGQNVVLHPGDTVCSGEGEGHSLRAHGNQPAEYLAVVVRK